MTIEYTEQGLRQACQRLMPGVEVMLQMNSTSMPEVVCRIIPAFLYYTRAEENEDTAILRQAFDDIAKKGHFNYGKR